MMSRPGGFTLIELLLVLAIGGLMVGLSTGVVSWYAKRSAEFDAIRSVDGLARQLPQLAARTSCWARLELSSAGQAVILKACGDVFKRVELPLGYKAVLDRPFWSAKPESQSDGSGLSTPTLHTGVWVSPMGEGVHAKLRLLHDDRPVAVFPLNSRDPG